MAKKKSKKCSSIADALQSHPRITGNHEVEVIGPFEGSLKTIFTFDKGNTSNPCASGMFAVKSICEKLCALTHETITLHYSFEKVDEDTGEVKIGEGKLEKESQSASIQ